MRNIFTNMLARMSPRAKIIGAAIVAFVIGMMLRGGSASNGRYMPCGNSPNFVLDTQNGSAWQLDGNRYRRIGSMPAW